MMKLYWYPKCSTCRSAKKWFDEAEITYELIDLVENTPTAAELAEMIGNSDIAINTFFNTRGGVYRELGLKEKMANLSDDEKIALLASNGMLIKRPLATNGEKVTLGFKAETYESTWK